jgi:hypothetical protein
VIAALNPADGKVARLFLSSGIYDGVDTPSANPYRFVYMSNSVWYKTSKLGGLGPYWAVAPQKKKKTKKKKKKKKERFRLKFWERVKGFLLAR